MQSYHPLYLHTFVRQTETLRCSLRLSLPVLDGARYVYLSSATPPSFERTIGLTGGATFNGIASVGFSFVASIKTLSTAGRHVRPPQIPMPARVRNFNSRAEHLYFLAVSCKSPSVTSSQRHIMISVIMNLLAI